MEEVEANAVEAGSTAYMEAPESEFENASIWADVLVDNP